MVAGTGTRRAFARLVAGWLLLGGAGREAGAARAASALDTPAVLLAREAAPEVSPVGFLVSEKYDGIRALWDGRCLRFRGGGEVAAPRWFLAGLPPHPLDGELWLGRGRFEALAAAVRDQQPDDSAWRAVRYMVYEWPQAPGTFAERAERLAASVARAGVPWLVAAPQWRVADAPTLRRQLNEVVRGGGEGLMLHLADAPYLTGRSEVLQKLKPQQDAEAVVIAHLPGKGRHAGRLGALQLRTPEGRVFALGTGFSDAQRDHPPPLGATVTYTYRGLTQNGLPRFASFHRVAEPPEPAAPAPSLGSRYVASHE